MSRINRIDLSTILLIRMKELKWTQNRLAEEIAALRGVDKKLAKRKYQSMISNFISNPESAQWATIADLFQCVGLQLMPVKIKYILSAATLDDDKQAE